MGKLFTEAEILRTAVKIEENGFRFYTEAAAKTTSAPVKEMCEFLAGQERGHIRTFTQILERIPHEDVPESYPGEEDDYLAVLASNNVFDNDQRIKDAVSKAADDTEIITIAQGMEKDSILFYLGMLRYIPKERHEAVKQLIEQEKEHLIKLSAIKATLN